MYITFNNLPEDSKIWIFQANRILTDQEIKKLDEMLKAFTEGWASHGNPLNSSYSIENKIHILVGVDLSFNQASGCSIDTLVHKIQEIGQEFNIDFFDRRAVAMETSSGVSILAFEDIKGAIENGVLKEDTVVFNNLISTKGELNTKWHQKASESWIKRYFNKNVVTT